jgi:hypothetical protein
VNSEVRSLTCFALQLCVISRLLMILLVTEWVM